MSEAEPDSAAIAFFDVDNTLLRGASIYYVGRAAWRRGLISLRDIAVFAWQQFRFLAVGENHEHLEHVRERALGLAGGHRQDELVELAEEVFEQDIMPRLWPETVALANEHLAQGHEVWLITATPELMAEVFARRLGLTGALGTRVETVDGVFTGRLDGGVLHGQQKATAARSLAAERGIDLADCWAYSDSRNDIPLLEAVGNRVVVNPDAALLKHAREHGWQVLPLKRASIREARRRLRRRNRGA